MNFASAEFRIALLVLAFASLSQADSIPPGWVSATGSAVSWTTGDAASGLAAITFTGGFLFPLFGQDYSSAALSSNGSLYFGGMPGNSQPLATVPELLQGLPRVAAAWYGIDSAAGGSILFNQLPDEAVFTFNGVASYQPPAGQSVSPSNLASFQMILDSTGTVSFVYQNFNSLNPALTGEANSLVGSQQAIVGITSGFGATDPGSLDLSALAASSGFSYTTGNDTIYQVVANNPSDSSNFAGLDLIFTPQVSAGWVVVADPEASGTTSQSVAPEPGTCFETALSGFAMLAWWRLKPSTQNSCDGAAS